MEGRKITHVQTLYIAYNRHNEVNLNLGFIQAEYATGSVRSKLALMTGTYANANLADEPGVLKNIFEANAGIKISKNKDLWVDAGVFASHIGFESAIGAHCWNMTRSILADNSPYYESGVKISYTNENGKWFFSGLLLNGWQTMQRIPGNQTPAFGHQLTWQPTEKIVLNSSSFIGNVMPDSIRQMRYFHNFYGQFELNGKLSLIAGFDIGAQQKIKQSSLLDTWFSPVLIGRYKLSQKLQIAARYEYYADRNEVMIYTGTPNGFQTHGYSLNIDAKVQAHVLWRVEGRVFTGHKDKVFLDKQQNPASTSCFVGISFSAGF